MRTSTVSPSSDTGKLVSLDCSLKGKGKLTVETQLTTVTQPLTCTEAVV